MIGGQAIDIESEGKTIDESTLLQMHRGKTSALFTACLEFGAILGKPKQSALLQELGSEIGLAYQFADDWLNATSTTQDLGKTAGSDAAKQKPTAVNIYGLDGVQRKLEELYLSIERKLDTLAHMRPLVQTILKLPC
jgi:farnesyl diphosphate synthase